MKFSCHRCKTRYSIADAKVRGKIVKVRCKKCSELIVVRERTLTSPNELERGGSGLLRIGQTPTATPPPPPAGDEVEWFYATDGRTEGPIIESRLAALLRDGRVPRGAHVWREGMGVWRPLTEVPEFASYAPQAPSAPPPPSAPPTLPMAPAAAIAAPPEFGDARGPATPTAAAPPKLPGPAALQGRAASPFDDSAGSLPSLQSLVDVQEVPANASEPEKTEESVPPPAASLGKGSSPPRAPARPGGGPSTSDTQRRKLLGIAVVATLGIVGAVAVALSGGGDEPPALPADAVATAPAPSPTPQEAPTGAKGGGEQDPADAAAEDFEELTFEAEDLWSDEEPKPKRKRKKRRASSSSSTPSKGGRQTAAQRDAAGNLAGPTGGTQRRMPGLGGIGGMGGKRETKTGDRLKEMGRSAAQAHLPESLGASEIKTVIKRHRKGLKQCLERHLKREGSDSVANQKVIISWKVSRSGRATAVKLSGGMAESVFGRCVTGQLKNWRFPQHRGKPVPVNYPVILTSSP